jgi:hypothetical protein
MIKWPATGDPSGFDGDDENAGMARYSADFDGLINIAHAIIPVLVSTAKCFRGSTKK